MLFGFPSAPKSRPPAIREPSTAVAAMTKLSPAPVAAVTSSDQYPAGTNAIRSRSRSTTIRVATLCTRPADRRGATFFQRTGETS